MTVVASKIGAGRWLRTVLMLIPKVEPSENGVFVGGHVNALKSLCRGMRDLAGRRPIAVTSLPLRKHALFRRFEPDWADFAVLANNHVAQSIWFGFTYMVKAAVHAWRHRRAEIDLVHGHSGFAIYAWSTLLTARLCATPSVHTLYCPIETKRARHLSRAVSVPALVRYPLRKVDRVIAISDNIARSLIGIGVEATRIEVIPPAIDCTVFSPERDGGGARARLGLAADARVVVYVGNLQPSKGLDLLLRAMPALVRRVPRTHLVATLELAHRGFEQRCAECVDFVAQNSLHHHVTWLGFVADMPELLAAADVFVVPYRDTRGPSDYPIAAMEAMASGRPVVATRIGALPELIEDGVTGRLVDVDDDQGLARAIGDLLSDDETCRQSGVVARRLIQARYSVEESWQRHHQLYETILRGA